VRGYGGFSGGRGRRGNTYIGKAHSVVKAGSGKGVDVHGDKKWSDGCDLVFRTSGFEIREKMEEVKSTDWPQRREEHHEESGV